MVYKEASESQAPEMMSQMRPKYFTNKMRTEELFTNLAEVNIFFLKSTYIKQNLKFKVWFYNFIIYHILFIKYANLSNIYQKNEYYDAFEEDFAILNVYFSQSTVIGIYND